MTETTPTDPPARLSIPQIAELLGFAERSVKKWRGHTLDALRAAGQLDHPAPTVPLPRNALPLPSNQAEHVRDGVHPRWDREIVEAWAERTERRHPVTKQPMSPTPPGRPPGPNANQPRRRRAPVPA
jgi:hypothetical protein